MKIPPFASWPLVHLFFPHICVGCGSDILSETQFICLQCIHELPKTNYAFHNGNPVEKIFWGRCKIEAAMSEWYFAKSSIVQNLIHEFKYKGNKELGQFLGNYIGKSIKESNRFRKLDLIVPLPLFQKKEVSRGFNQSEILCNGIAEILQIPVHNKNVIRKISTESQTRKQRTDRWENVAETFQVQHPHLLEKKNILLVDDVITTGATLESCASKILSITDTKVFIATLAVAMH